MATVKKMIGTIKEKIANRLLGAGDRYSVSCRIDVKENPIASDNTFSDMIKFMENRKKVNFSNENSKLEAAWKEYISSGKKDCQALRKQALEYRELCSARDSEMEKVDKSAYENVLKSRNEFKSSAISLVTKEHEKAEAVKKIKQKREEALKNLEKLRTQLDTERSKQKEISKSAVLSKNIPQISEIKNLNELESTLNLINGIEGHDEIKQRIDNLAKKLKGQIESLSEKFKAEGGNFTTDEAWEIYFSDRKNPKQNFRRACGDLSSNQLKEVNLAIDVANSKLKALKGAVKTASSEYKKKVKATEKEQKEAAKQEKTKARAEKKAAKK